MTQAEARIAMRGREIKGNGRLPECGSDRPILHVAG